MTWYRVVLRCEGVPVDAGAQAAVDITDDFSKRKSQTNAHCIWEGSPLLLTTENDFDKDGLATLDEFSDEISANVRGGFDGGVAVISVTFIP